MSLHQNQIEPCMLYEFKKSTSAKETEILVMEMFVPANNSLGLGMFSLNDSLLSVRQSFVNTDLLQNIVEENPKQTTRELAKRLNNAALGS